MSDREYWATRAAEKHRELARQYREEAERIRFFRDRWIEEGRTDWPQYLGKYFQNTRDDGDSAIADFLRTADWHDEKAGQTYKETMDEFAHEDALRAEEEKMQKIHEKANEMLDDWFSKQKD